MPPDEPKKTTRAIRRASQELQLTEEMRQRRAIAIEGIEGGLSIKDAMQLAGYSKEHYYNLKEEPEFAAALEAARLRNKKRALLIIERAALKEWTAAAWLMERKYKDEFGRVTKMEHSGTVDVRARALELLNADPAPDTDGDTTQSEG